MLTGKKKSPRVILVSKNDPWRRIIVLKEAFSNSGLRTGLVSLFKGGVESPLAPGMVPGWTTIVTKRSGRWDFVYATIIMSADIYTKRYIIETICIISSPILADPDRRRPQNERKWIHKQTWPDEETRKLNVSFYFLQNIWMAFHPD